MTQYKIGGADWQSAQDDPPTLMDWLSNETMQRRLSRFVIEDPDDELIEYLQNRPETIRPGAEVTTIRPDKLRGDDYEVMYEQLLSLIQSDNSSRIVVLKNGEAFRDEKYGALLATLLSILEDPPGANGTAFIIATEAIEPLPGVLYTPARVDAVFVPDQSWFERGKNRIKDAWSTLFG